MKSKNTNEFAKSMTTTIAVVMLLTILVWLNHDAMRAFIDLIRDREAVVALLDQLGFIGPLVLMALVGLQILVAALPAEPLMIAGAYAYGFGGGFLMNWLVTVAASQAVYYLARHAGRPVVERFVPAELLDKWTRIASERGMIFFLLAFAIPLVPSDIMNFVAGLSAIGGRRFFVVSLFGRMPMIALLTLVGANGFRITPAMIVGLTVISVLVLMAWWYLMRERPDAVASSSDQSNAGRSDRCDDSVPIAPRRSPNPILSLTRQSEGRIRPAQAAQAGTLGTASRTPSAFTSWASRCFIPAPLTLSTMPGKRVCAPRSPPMAPC